MFNFLYGLANFRSIYICYIYKYIYIIVIYIVGYHISRQVTIDRCNRVGVCFSV